jgi:hypothetical protein
VSSSDFSGAAERFNSGGGGSHEKMKALSFCALNETSHLPSGDQLAV